MTQYLKFVAGEAIKLDGLTLPGIVTDIEITGEFDLERKRLEGRSFRTALAKGYKDAVVLISLEILPPDAEAQVKQIEAAFKINYAGAKPKPQRIVNPLLDARGVTAVLFKRFVTRQGSEDDALLCTLEFAEYEPLIGRIEGSAKPPTKGRRAGVCRTAKAVAAVGGVARRQPQTQARLKGRQTQRASQTLLPIGSTFRATVADDHPRLPHRLPRQRTYRRSERFRLARRPLAHVRGCLCRC